MKFHKLPHFTRDVTGQHYRRLPSDVSLPRISERRRRLKFRLVKARVEGYFFDVCLPNTELRSNDIRIQTFCFGKPHSFLCIVEPKCGPHPISQKVAQKLLKKTTTTKTRFVLFCLNLFGLVQKYANSTILKSSYRVIVRVKVDLKRTVVDD